jgi:hypothetical protein
MDRRVGILVLVLVLLVIAGLFSGSGPEPIRLSEGSSVVGIQNVNVQDGRLVEYDFEIGEKATLVPNRAGSDHEGLIQGNVTRVSRNGGSAVHFNGTDGQIVVENSSSFDTRDGVTFAFWINPDEDQRGNIIGNVNSYWFYVTGGNTVYFVVRLNGTRIAMPSADVPVGEWTHVMGTYDPDQGAKLYVNGEVADANTTANATINTTSTIRLNMGGWKNGFNGSVDEFSLWNESLSETEIRMVQQGRDGGLIFSSPLRIAMTLLLILLIVGVTVRSRVF